MTAKKKIPPPPTLAETADVVLLSIHLASIATFFFWHLAWANTMLGTRYEPES